jgi:hypothetical protein
VVTCTSKTTCTKIGNSHTKLKCFYNHFKKVSHLEESTYTTWFHPRKKATQSLKVVQAIKRTSITKAKGLAMADLATPKDKRVSRSQ